jgi:hypothetical protein
MTYDYIKGLYSGRLLVETRKATRPAKHSVKIKLKHIENTIGFSSLEKQAYALKNGLAKYAIAQFEREKFNGLIG